MLLTNRAKTGLTYFPVLSATTFCFSLQSEGVLLARLGASGRWQVASCLQGVSLYKVVPKPVQSHSLCGPGS